MKKVVSGIILTMLLTSMLPLVFNVRPVEAWGKSGKVAVIDDFYGDAVGYLSPSDYPDYTFTALSASQVSPETLASYDTVIMFMFDPGLLNSAQKAAIVAWVFNGGKLLIWDSDQVPRGSPWDYTWLSYPFTTSVPGQTGRTGKGLNILEENQLSSSDPSSPYYIDTAVLNSQTDAVGDANVLISYSPSWHIDMMATNVLGETGPAHVYAAYGSGLIIYSALDWNYAGYNIATGVWLKKILKQELECSYLPFAAPTVPEEVGLEVEVTSDKGFYNVSETINFEVTVSNPTNKTGINLVAENVALTVIEPEEVEIYQLGGGISVGNIGPGESNSTTFYGKARKAGVNVILTVNALGRTRLGYIGGRGSCTISIYDSATFPEPDWSYAIITDIHIGYNSWRWDSDNDGYKEIDYASRGWDDSLQHEEHEDYYVTKNLENAVDKIITEKGPYKTKFVVVLGDISDTAEKSEFLKAREILNRLNDPNGNGNTDDGIPYIPLFGNHDPWPYAQDTLEADDRYRYAGNETTPYIASNATGDKFFKDIFWGESNGNNKRLIENLFGNSWNYTYDNPVHMKARRILGKWVQSYGYEFEECGEDGNRYYDKDHKTPTIFEGDYYLQNYGFTYDGITFVCLDLVPRLGEGLPWDGVALPGIDPQGGIAAAHKETIEFSKDYTGKHKATETKKIVLFSHYPLGLLAGSAQDINNEYITPVSGYKLYNFFGHWHLTGDIYDLDLMLSNEYYGILTEDVADILPNWVNPWSLKLAERLGFKRTRETVRIVQIKNGEIDYSTTLKPKSVEILWPFPDFAYPYASYPEPNKEITFTARFTNYHGFRTSFDWDFGDGSYASGSSVKHSYSQDGLYNVTLTVTTKNLVTGEEKTYTATHHIYVHSKHVISPLPSDLNATSLLTGEDLTQVPKNTYQPTLITKSTSEEIPIAELGVHFEEATEDIDLSALMADVDLEEAKSVIYMSSWPEEIEEYKVLFIPSTGTGTVYICSNATSLDEVNLENADIVIKVGETKDGIAVTTTFYNGREYYLVSGITGTGGGEVKDTIPPTTLLIIGEPKYVAGTIYVTPDTQFNLTATDNPGGTGVALTAYKIRNATYSSVWLTYTEPFYLTGLIDGVYTIDYNSTDNANNVEPTNTINVTLFSWNYVFTDSYGRETTLKINTEHHFFQFITPDNDYGIRNATYMRRCGRAIIIKHYDNELRLITVAVDTKLDFCVAIAWDVQTGKRYFLIDKAGTE